MEDESGLFSVTSVVSAASGRGFVQLRWPRGSDGHQMTPHEARRFGLQFFEVAEAAESDAFLVGFLQQEVEVSRGQAVHILARFRAYRLSHPPQDRPADDAAAATPGRTPP